MVKPCVQLTEMKYTKMNETWPYSQEAYIHIGVALGMGEEWEDGWGQ